MEFLRLQEFLYAGQEYELGDNPVVVPEHLQGSLRVHQAEDGTWVAIATHNVFFHPLELLLEDEVAERADAGTTVSPG